MSALHDRFSTWLRRRRDRAAYRRIRLALADLGYRVDGLHDVQIAGSIRRMMDTSSYEVRFHLRMDRITSTTRKDWDHLAALHLLVRTGRDLPRSPDEARAVAKIRDVIGAQIEDIEDRVAWRMDDDDPTRFADYVRALHRDLAPYVAMVAQICNKPGIETHFHEAFADRAVESRR